MCDCNVLRICLHYLTYYFRSFLTIRHPPSSTLFPYTTLFRSRCCTRSATTRRGPRFARWRSATRRAPWRTGDRKSTRLNSSHLVISYAVFCLKKKKQIISHLILKVLLSSDTGSKML